MAQKKEQSLSTLKASLELCIGKLERFEQFVAAITSPLEDIVHESLSLRLEQLKSIPGEYRDLVVKANSLSVSSDDYISYLDFEDKFFQISAKASLILKCQSNEISNSSNSINSGNNVSNTNVKLPTLKIPTFSGDFSEWSSFIETFGSLVDHNSSLSDIEKFFYLHDSLKGTAKDVLQDLAITACNYQIAMQMLKDRFENERLILFSHLEGILEMNRVGRESATELRKFHDSLTRHLRALDNLKLSGEEFKNAVIAYTLKTKLDSSSVSEFSKLKPKQIPDWDEMNKFLSQRCEAMEEALSSHSQKSRNNSNSKFSSNSKAHNLKQTFVATSAKPSSSKCPFCKNDHFLNQCEKFLSLSVKQRYDKINELRLCKNCLRHSTNLKCYSKHLCQICNKKHNKLLHFEQQVERSNPNSRETQETEMESPRSVPTLSVEAATFTPGPQASLSCLQTNVHVLLATARVKVKGKNGWLMARCLLDSASQQSFVTEEFFGKLGIQRKPINSTVLGLNSSVSQINSVTNIQISSNCSNFQAEISCLIIPKITENLPFTSFDASSLNIPKNITLADDYFNESGPIDILLGASIFYELLLQGQIRLGKNAPILNSTHLGWVIAGDVWLPYAASVKHVGVTHFSRNDCLEQSVAKFWEIESVEPKNKSSLLSPSEHFCEEHFSETKRNDDSGRYIVSIPFNQALASLGESREQAHRRFLALERKLSKDTALRHEYVKFMQEYKELGHMTEVSSVDSIKNDTGQVIRTFNSDRDVSQLPAYYMPHHAVQKPESVSTKLRVVFDGSAKTESGVSINDAQIVGPVVQSDLFSILMRFREFKVALTGDIEKAYRQILVDPVLRKFQLILWRNSPSEAIATYSLNTVTYGTASASFLTTRCLLHLAESNVEAYPKAAQVLKTCFYMDDLLTGADSAQEVIQIKDQLMKILKSAGFPLRKFLSNDKEVLISLGDSASPLLTIPVGDRESAKTLGIVWNASADVFQFKFQFPTVAKTKRGILSIISRIFDPLGILQPVIVRGKLLVQKLWQLRIGWDDPIPESLRNEWDELSSQLQVLNSVEVPRCVRSEDVQDQGLDLVGFSDASSVAYGACVYVRCKRRAILLCSKSRVAPLHGVTIPRLELCAAVLLAELMEKVQNTLSIDFRKVYYFSDSQIVLHWLKATPSRFKVFVANRIAYVQEISDIGNWFFVDSKNNPADIVSRGCTPQELLKNQLWFHGPTFMSSEQKFERLVEKCPTGQFPSDEFKEKHQKVTLVNVTKIDIFKRFSTFLRLQRVVAWIWRFVNNTRKLRITGPLTADELHIARDSLIKLCQRESFDFRKINEYSGKGKSLQGLNPFLDESGFIRVGGRISASNFSYDKKHPILLPKGHSLTGLILKHLHEDLLHCGSQQLLACARESYWPLGGRSAVRQVIHNCVKCFRAKPSSVNPLMGSLPPARLTSNSPVFTHVGVDYAGPVLIKDRKLRGSKLIKAYICLFVCLVTKSLHLELVTDLTTNAFLAVLKRFIGRRGKPNLIMSDNGTNFVGASNQLRELFGFLNSSETQKEVSDFLSVQGITWKFIIPRAPHVGGIWESGVKSTKAHLTRVLGNTQLSYEDFQTVLIQVESVLNSRPLCPISSDPNDLTPLTCGHFLIGKPLIAMPQPGGLDVVKENRLSVYQRIQRIVQDFWKRWNLEVVPEYQRRTKWFSRLPDLVKINSIVLLKDDNLPPQKWSLGRVTEIHRSADGVIRSASLRMSNGHIVKRTVHKMCVFPETE